MWTHSHPCPCPRSKAPQKFSDPFSLCVSYLLSSLAPEPCGELGTWQGRAHCPLPPQLAARWVRATPRTGLQASAAGSASAAGPGRRRVHTWGPGLPAPSTPGGRPPAALGHTPPAGPRRVPQSPSCSPGAQMAGIWPPAPAMGCSAPEGSPPAMTGQEGVSGTPKHPVPTHTGPSQMLLGHTTGPAPPPATPSHQLDPLRQGPGLQCLGQQHMLGLAQGCGQTMQQRLWKASRGSSIPAPRTSPRAPHQPVLPAGRRRAQPAPPPASRSGAPGTRGRRPPDRAEAPPARSTGPAPAGDTGGQ